jgi:hypothetical protein
VASGIVLARIAGSSNSKTLRFKNCAELEGAGKDSVAEVEFHSASLSQSGGYVEPANPKFTPVSEGVYFTAGKTVVDGDSLTALLADEPAEAEAPL